MGMFKQLKDMKDMVAAAPGMVQQAQELGAQAQQMAAAQQAAAMAQVQAAQAAAGAVPGGAVAGPDFEPIAGVSLETYAAVSRGVAAAGYDASRLPEVAAGQGVAAGDWEQASAGWAARIRSNPAVGQRFNALYRAG
jgi:hypothetical protein